MTAPALTQNQKDLIAAAKKDDSTLKTVVGQMLCADTLIANTEIPTFLESFGFTKNDAGKLTNATSNFTLAPMTTPPAAAAAATGDQWYYQQQGGGSWTLLAVKTEEDETVKQVSFPVAAPAPADKAKAGDSRVERTIALFTVLAKLGEKTADTQLKQVSALHKQYTNKLNEDGANKNKIDDDFFNHFRYWYMQQQLRLATNELSGDVNAKNKIAPYNKEYQDNITEKDKQTEVLNAFISATAEGVEPFLLSVTEEQLNDLHKGYKCDQAGVTANENEYVYKFTPTTQQHEDQGFTVTANREINQKTNSSSIQWTLTVPGNRPQLASEMFKRFCQHTSYLQNLAIVNKHKKKWSSDTKANRLQSKENLTLILTGDVTIDNRPIVINDAMKKEALKHFEYIVIKGAKWMLNPDGNPEQCTDGYMQATSSTVDGDSNVPTANDIRERYMLATGHCDLSNKAVGMKGDHDFERARTSYATKLEQNGVKLADIQLIATRACVDPDYAAGERWTVSNIAQADNNENSDKNIKKFNHFALIAKMGHDLFKSDFTYQQLQDIVEGDKIKILKDSFDTMKNYPNSPNEHNLARFQAAAMLAMNMRSGSTSLEIKFGSPLSWGLNNAKAYYDASKKNQLVEQVIALTKPAAKESDMNIPAYQDRFNFDNYRIRKQRVALLATPVNFSQDFIVQFDSREVLAQSKDYPSADSKKLISAVTGISSERLDPRDFPAIMRRLNLATLIAAHKNVGDNELDQARHAEEFDRVLFGLAGQDHKISPCWKDITEMQHQLLVDTLKIQDFSSSSHVLTLAALMEGDDKIQAKELSALGIELPEWFNEENITVSPTELQQALGINEKFFQELQKTPSTTPRQQERYQARLNQAIADHCSQWALNKEEMKQYIDGNKDLHTLIAESSGLNLTIINQQKSGPILEKMTQRMGHQNIAAVLKSSNINMSDSNSTGKVTRAISLLSAKQASSLLLAMADNIKYPKDAAKQELIKLGIPVKGVIGANPLLQIAKAAYQTVDRDPAQLKDLIEKLLESRFSANAKKRIIAFAQLALEKPGLLAADPLQDNIDTAKRSLHRVLMEAVTRSNHPIPKTSETRSWSKTNSAATLALAGDVDYDIADLDLNNLAQHIIHASGDVPATIVPTDANPYTPADQQTNATATNVIKGSVTQSPNAHFHKAASATREEAIAWLEGYRNKRETEAPGAAAVSNIDRHQHRGYVLAMLGITANDNVSKERNFAHLTATDLDLIVGTFDTAANAQALLAQLQTLPRDGDSVNLQEATRDNLRHQLSTQLFGAGDQLDFEINVPRKAMQAMCSATVRRLIKQDANAHHIMGNDPAAAEPNRIFHLLKHISAKQATALLDALKPAKDLPNEALTNYDSPTHKAQVQLLLKALANIWGCAEDDVEKLFLHGTAPAPVVHGVGTAMTTDMIHTRMDYIRQAAVSALGPRPEEILTIPAHDARSPKNSYLLNKSKDWYDLLRSKDIANATNIIFNLPTGDDAARTVDFNNRLCAAFGYPVDALDHMHLRGEDLQQMALGLIQQLTPNSLNALAAARDLDGNPESTQLKILLQHALAAFNDPATTTNTKTETAEKVRALLNDLTANQLNTLAGAFTAAHNTAQVTNREPTLHLLLQLCIDDKAEDKVIAARKDLQIPQQLNTHLKSANQVGITSSKKFEDSHTAYVNACKTDGLDAVLEAAQLGGKKDEIKAALLPAATEQGNTGANINAETCTPPAENADNNHLGGPIALMRFTAAMVNKAQPIGTAELKEQCKKRPVTEELNNAANTDLLELDDNMKHNHLDLRVASQNAKQIAKRLNRDTRKAPTNQKLYSLLDAASQAPDDYDWNKIGQLLALTAKKTILNTIGNIPRQNRDPDPAQKGLMNSIAGFLKTEGANLFGDSFTATHYTDFIAGLISGRTQHRPEQIARQTERTNLSRRGSISTGLFANQALTRNHDDQKLLSLLRP